MIVKVFKEVVGYDYIALVAATSRPMLQDIIDNKLYKVEGVQNTESFIFLEERGFYLPSHKFEQIYKDSAEMYEAIWKDYDISNMMKNKTI